MSEPIGWAQDYIDAFDALIKLGETQPGYYSPQTLLTLRARRQHWIDVREHEKQARKQKALESRSPDGDGPSTGTRQVLAPEDGVFPVGILPEPLAQAQAGSEPADSHQFIDPLADANAFHRAEILREHTADVLAWYR